MGKTIGIGHESQGLFHLNSPLCSTACTSMEAPLLLHNRLSHPSLSKFRKLVPHFSSLSSLECEACKTYSCLVPKAFRSSDKASFCMIRSLILSYHLINLSFASLLVSLVVSVLFIFSFYSMTNSHPKPRSVSS